MYNTIKRKLSTLNVIIQMIDKIYTPICQPFAGKVSYKIACTRTLAKADYCVALHFVNNLTSLISSTDLRPEILLGTVMVYILYFLYVYVIDQT